MSSEKVFISTAGSYINEQLDSDYFKQYYKDCTIKTKHGYWFVKNGHLKVDRFTAIFGIVMHLLYFVSLSQLYFEFNVKTYLWYMLLNAYALLCSTGGAHRLWSHRSFTAATGLRIFLMIGQTLSVQFSCATWAKLHRVHHKWTDTDADPYNSQRGYVFCHIGWALVRKHPEFMEKQALLNFDDLKNDPVLQFQKKYYFKLLILIAFIIPAIVPMVLWGETFLNAFLVCVVNRILWTLHNTLNINSMAHMFGDRPYDQHSSASENKWIGTLGECYHNFHHKFPIDYASSELPSMFNSTQYFIELMAKCGWASNLKRAPQSLIDLAKLNSITSILNTHLESDTNNYLSRSNMSG